MMGYTMIVREGLLICVYEWVTLVYGSYEHVPISYGVVPLFKAGYYTPPYGVAR